MPRSESSASRRTMTPTGGTEASRQLSRDVLLGRNVLPSGRLPRRASPEPDARIDRPQHKIADQRANHRNRAKY